MAAALTVASRASAEPATAATEPVEFNIPAQFVPAALSEFARQARVQLFFISDGFEEIQANAVIGSYSPQQAIDLLLAGTGLVARLSPESGIQVSPVSTTRNSMTGGSQFIAAQSMDSAGGRYSDAQDDPEAWPSSQHNADDTNPHPEKMEEIQVTGSRIRGAESAAPVITITHEDIDNAGFATVEQLVQSLPQNFGGGAGQLNNTHSPNLGRLSIGQITGSEVSIDLRGLGSDSTLVLLDGRRMSTGGFDGAFVDVSSIPVTAIERVEILTDGASAIYGADAIAGVVNFILRDDFDGAETRLRYGTVADGDMADTRFGQLWGKSWDRGNVLLSYEYYKQDNLKSSERAATATNDLRPLGGDDWRIPGGNPGTIIAGGETYAIPAGQDGTSLMPSDFVAGTQNLFNRLFGLDAMPAQKRHSVFLTYRQKFSDTTEFLFAPRYSRREAVIHEFQSTIDLDVPDSNPFFVDPSDSGLTSVRVDDYPFIVDLGPQIKNGLVETYGSVTGIKFNIGSDWNGELTGVYAKERSLTVSENSFSSAAARLAVAETTRESAFNPFADGSNTNPEVLESILIRGHRQDVDQDLLGVHLDFAGRLFELPSGTARLATGLEFRDESFTNSRTQESFQPGTNDRRQIAAAYAELFLPLVGSDNVIFGIHRLEASLAARYDDYSDFGKSTNPKFGILWAPIRSLNVRGTIGSSFKPPLLTQLDTAPSGENFDTWFDFTPVPTIFQSGGNADLKPEEATTWTAGIQFVPTNLSGFTLDLTYFHVAFDNRIARAAPSLFMDVFDPAFESIVVLNPTQDQINAIANSDRYVNLGASAQDLIQGRVPVTAIVDFRLGNVSKSEVSGLDLQLHYAFDSFIGHFDAGLNASYLYEILDTLRPGDEAVDRVDTVSNPVDLRIRGNLSWSRGGWRASAYVNYTDSYTNNQRDPNVDIDAWTTMDMQLAYDTEDRFSSDLLSRMRFSLSVQNLFGEDPPFVNSNRGIGYDPVNASVLGRYFAFEINKAWGRQ